MGLGVDQNWLEGMHLCSDLFQVKYQTASEATCILAEIFPFVLCLVLQK